MADRDENRKSRRGFASMDPARQAEISSMGGKAAHAQGRAHEFTKEEARAAGRKGGEIVSANRAHMARIGRMGGRLRGTGSAKTKKAPSAIPKELPSGVLPKRLTAPDDEEE